ncbi:FecR domain-containing protein [Chitinimonas lacunae]|uniref:FecR domain-containing protein n=1 Tax=Chitinimonas lacunae TaxID=1963018 RepID=A0ABV8MS09_9NEIS
MRRLLLAALLSAAAYVEAASTVVTAVNMPAWLEREGRTLPLSPSLALQPRDTIRTGPGARVRLQLPEGSEVKLGENAVFRMENLNLSDGRTSPFQATLEVLKGAFRFTTGLLGGERKRQVDVRIQTITAGIRGTDIWGRSDEEKDLVCLLEGRIGVSREGEPAQEMSEPLSFYVAPRGKPSLPISKVDPDKVKNEWAPQTEPQAGQGLTEQNGRWTLTLARVKTQKAALEWYDRLRQAGYAAKIRSGDGHAVRLEQLGSEADAKALGQRLQTEFKTPLAEVKKR